VTADRKAPGRLLFSAAVELFELALGHLACHLWSGLRSREPAARSQAGDGQRDGGNGCVLDP
jgi:hypothetical protein